MLRIDFRTLISRRVVLDWSIIIRTKVYYKDIV